MPNTITGALAFAQTHWSALLSKPVIPTVAESLLDQSNGSLRTLDPGKRGLI